jgi:hypothetical protein
MVCPCRHAGDADVADPRPSGVYSASRWWIDLTLGRRASRVELPRLVVVRVLGKDVARLDDLWAAARFGVRASGLFFDFVGADGYRLGTELEGGIEGPALSTGYICVATRDLLWAPAPERPAFWRVKGVVSVLASPRTRGPSQTE